MTKLFILLAFVLLSSLSFSAFAQNKQEANISREQLITKIEEGLTYLKQTQRTQMIPGKAYRGEWPTFMGLENDAIYLGKKSKYDDSNCFSVASIHNMLAEIYLMDSSLQHILPMLDLAFENITNYQSGKQFNFWNLLPPNGKHRKSDVIAQQPLVRRPTNYPLKYKYIRKAANIVNDADDTALGQSAIALRKKYKDSTSASPLPEVASIFERYKDTDRNNRHWYNYLNRSGKNTGAYLTWLAEEFQFNNWNILKVVGHNATFYLPFSECYPHAYIPYMPYGSNDIDGVVNANILNALALNNELNASGVQPSVQFIEKLAKRGRYDRAGIYYPNRYHFPYAVSKAYAQGVQHLDKSVQYLQQYILKEQNSDGSWSSRKTVNNRDSIQSTAYAVGALLSMNQIENPTVKNAIDRGINYLLESVQSKNDVSYWEGGVFFSGGTVVRNTLFWTSDAYTTAVVLHSFALYLKST